MWTQSLADYHEQYDIIVESADIVKMFSFHILHMLAGWTPRVNILQDQDCDWSLQMIYKLYTSDSF